MSSNHLRVFDSCYRQILFSFSISLWLFGCGESDDFSAPLPQAQQALSQHADDPVPPAGRPQNAATTDSSDNAESNNQSVAENRGPDDEGYALFNLKTKDTLCLSGPDSYYAIKSQMPSINSSKA